MDIGFIGLGHMGFPMARRLLDAGHDVVAFDTRAEALNGLVACGARAASSPADVAGRAETVLASLPSPHIALDVAAGLDGDGMRRYVDLSTIGSAAAVRIHDLLAARDIVAVDCPVSGGVSGAEAGTLALMVSCPRSDFEALLPVLRSIGRPMHVGEQPGSAQTMKLMNNILAATVLIATSEVVVMGAKSGLDPEVIIDVLNAGSAATSASRDKFPRAILPRTFDSGFATALMVKDVRLYLEEANALGVPVEIAEAVARLWETTLCDEGAESDFTAAIKPIERAAGVTVGGSKLRE
jgi:3-hydroxyisobutyrate dehydrogenase-like beta-hydroxyacid dehydrogenase